MSLVVKLEGVSRSFQQRYVLRDIHLNITQGDRIALHGPNGAGKTTLLRIIATLLRPTVGTIQLFEADADEPRASLRKRIGILLRESFLYGDLTVFENLSLYANLYSIPSAKKRISNWLEKYGMQSYAGQTVSRLSRGERQKITLIRTLLHDPQLILLDEPTVGLDKDSIDFLSTLLQELRPSQSLVCISHNNSFLETWQTKSIRLDQGIIQ